MIRLIQRRLIIPQGDTGTFTIPIQGTMDEHAEAWISIYDNLTHKTVLEKQMTVTNENTLQYVFQTEDTVNIEPDDRGSRYSWDITILRGVERDENGMVHCDSVDSYYAAFELPPCVIKRVTRDVQK